MVKSVVLQHVGLWIQAPPMPVHMSAGTKRSTDVAPEMNLKNTLCVDEKIHKHGFQSHHKDIS